MLATIGYERSTLDDFVATLKVVNTDILVDIRERAQSRRPGFSKNALASALEAVGITYVHMPELGDPKEGRDAARSGNFDLFRQIFGEAMKTPDAKAALSEIESLALSKNVCLMCFERDQNHCHRKIVSDFLDTRLPTKTVHRGVKLGASNATGGRRVLHPDQGATASVQ